MDMISRCRTLIKELEKSMLEGGYILPQYYGVTQRG